MQTTVDFLDALYRKSFALAASRGATVEQFIIEAVAKEVQGDIRSSASDPGSREVELPLIHSKRPGTLDLPISTLMSYLADLNLWIALVADQHVHTRQRADDSGTLETT